MLTVMLASSSMLVTAFSTPCLTKTMTTATTTMTLYLSDETPSESDAAPAAAAVDPNVKCPNCDLCDGSGRIAGGLGAVVSWLPIKAYRPCPNFIERGGNYQRTGQPLDEIAFGKDKKRGT